METIENKEKITHLKVAFLLELIEDSRTWKLYNFILENKENNHHNPTSTMHTTANAIITIFIPKESKKKNHHQKNPFLHFHRPTDLFLGPLPPIY